MVSCTITLAVVLVVFQITRVQAEVDDHACLITHFTEFFETLEKMNKIRLDFQKLSPEDRNKLGDKKNLKTFHEEYQSTGVKDVERLIRLIQTTYDLYKDNLIQKKELPKASPEVTVLDPVALCAASPSHDVAASPSHDVAASPSHDVAASPSRNDAASPSHNDAASPSHDVAASPSHNDAASPSRDVAAPPSHDDAAPPSHDDAASPSHDDAASPSHDDAASPSHDDAASPSHDDAVDTAEKKSFKLFIDATHKLCDDIKKDTETCSETVRNSIPIYEDFSILYLQITGDDGKNKLIEHCGALPERQQLKDIKITEEDKRVFGDLLLSTPQKVVP